MRLKLCCAAIAVVLMLAGCGDDSGSSSGDDQAAATAQTTPNAESEVYDNPLPKPRGPGAHPGARVEQLVVKDIRVGTGREISAGDNGVFDFIGADYVTGKPLDDSWGRRRPFETQIEKGVVIDGWWQGIAGMRVGGRRQLIIPPSLGFTSGFSEAAGATTYFDVVLLAVRPQQPEALQPREAEAPATG